MAEIRDAEAHETATHDIGGLGTHEAGPTNGVSVHSMSVHNGMSARHLGHAAWRRSRYSGSVGNCVELAPLTDGGIAVRNSRHPDGPALVYTKEEITAFLFGAKDGEFDDMIA